MSLLQFDTQYPVPIGDPGDVFTITGPLKTDEDRIRDEATITIFVRILQTQTQSVAIGHNVIVGAGLTRWSCPMTIQSGGFQPGPALIIATIVEAYSDPEEHYTYSWNQKINFV